MGRRGGLGGIGIEEGVDADDGQSAVVLEVYELTQIVQCFLG